MSRMTEEVVADEISKYPLIIVGGMLILVVCLTTLYLQSIGRFDIMANLGEIWFWIANALITLGIGLITRGFFAGRITKPPTSKSEQPATPEPPSRSSTRTAIRNQTFRNEDVRLDGYGWIECKFIGCNIIVERGDFDLISNSFLFFPEILVIEPTVRARTSPSETEPNLTLLKLGYQSLVKQDLLAIEPQFNPIDPKPIYFKSWNTTEAALKKQYIDNESVYGIIDNISRLLTEWNAALDRASLLMLKPDSKIYLYIQSCKKYYEKLREIDFLS